MEIEEVYKFENTSDIVKNNLDKSMDNKLMKQRDIKRKSINRIENNIIKNVICGGDTIKKKDSNNKSEDHFSFEIIDFIDFSRFYCEEEIDITWKAFIDSIKYDISTDNSNKNSITSDDSFEIIDTSLSFHNNSKLHKKFSIIFNDKELWKNIYEYTVEQLWYQAEKDVSRMKIFLNSIKIEDTKELLLYLGKHSTTLITKKIAYLCSQTFLAKPFIMLQEFIWNTYDETLFIASSPHHIYLNIFLSKDNKLHFILHKKLSIKNITCDKSKIDNIQTLFDFYLAFNGNTMTLFSPKNITI